MCRDDLNRMAKESDKYAIHSLEQLALYATRLRESLEKGEAGNWTDERLTLLEESYREATDSLKESEVLRRGAKGLGK
jgi:CTP-dependent riboflavin kinase